MKKINLIISKAIPNKKTLYTILFTLTLGIISGSIFLLVIGQNDKKTVIETVKLFMNNINTNNINNVQALKNSLISNYIYIILIWILGFSLIGIVFNIFIVYIKGFIVGFSISTLIYTYGLKGIISSLIYLIPSEIINILNISILSTYSIILTKYLFKIIIGNKNINIKQYIKIYFFILIIISILSFLSSILEVFLTTSLYRLLIKLFI